MSGDVSLGTAAAAVTLDYSGLERGIATSKSLVSGLETSLLGIGAIGAGLAVATTKMAGNFESGLTSLSTGAGELKSNLGLVSAGILQTATDTGTATKDLLAGEYLIDSSGQKGKQSLLTLKDAAEGAKVGAASLADVANGVTTEMTDYAKSHVTAAGATNELIAAVSAGKTHMGDLSNALANILPTASAAGVGLTDVMGAMATMTSEGIPAAQAATYLRQTILGLEAPSAGTVKALDAVGLKSSDVAAEMKKSLPDALQMITDAVGKKFPEGSQGYIDAIKNISGGSKTMQGMLDLTGDHLKTFNDNVSNISSTVKKGGDSIVGWSQVQGDFNTKVDQAREVVETLGIKIGTALLPVATSLFDLVLPLVSGFDDWITKSGALSQITSDLSTDVSNIAGFVSTLTGNVNSCGTTFGQANPLLYDAQTVFGNIKDILPDVGQFLSDVGTDINTNILPPVESLVTNVAGAVTNFSNWADKSGAAKTALQDLSGFISGTTQVLGPLIQGVSNVVGWLGGGGAGTDTLVVAVSAVGTAFLGLKIADTVSQFSNLWTKLSDGEGVLANLASSFKDKLGGAVDGFLSKQAPNFKQSLDDMRKKSDDAGTSVEAVGTKAKTAGDEVASSSKTMEGDMKAVGTSADGAGTKVEAVGADAKTASGEVKGAAVEEETSLSGVGTKADETGTSMLGIGKDAETSAGEVATASKAEELNLATVGTDAKLTGEAELTIGTDAEAAAATAKSAFGAIAGSMGFLGGLLSLTNIHVIPDTGTGQYKNYHLLQNARGGKNIPAGRSLVGEEGPEIIDVPGGSDIYPHGQVPTSVSSSSYGGGSYSGGSSSHAALLAAAREMGREIASALASHQTLLSVDGNVLGQAMVQHMRLGTGMRF